MTEKQEYLPGICHIIPAHLLRETPNVNFFNIPVLEGLSAVDHVLHGNNALSPAIQAGNTPQERLWYMHPYQDDNLYVISGTRYVDLYTPEHGQVESFEITTNSIKHNGKIIYEGHAIFGWNPYVFHKVNSGSEGSNSLNFARHFEGFNLKDNFNIYDLDVKTGAHKVIREGFRDQPHK
ncbi:MAG: hypothetical protein ACTSXQ_06995 [Alphaproteobacteria bacterium]